ncbi:serine hydrolase-like protein 2 [Anticarsia gemmatalis]|uniref:serine hydrolase-like protein 2 n=1 Tax=Anticarsia gemmatalis TaxID=129554 RepID=UPI003F768B32
MSLSENEWYIQAPWGRIAIIAWGNCYDPPVLLCHGNMDSAVSFRPLVNLLPQKYYYIGVELPGNGKSDPFPPGLMISIYDILYSLHAVVKHFRWESFIYIGHSFGAVLGKIYNICYPDTISKLVELDPINFIGIPPEDFPKWYKYFFEEFYKNYEKLNAPRDKAPKLKWKEALSSLRAKRPGLSEQHAIAVLERLSEPVGDGLIRYTFDRRNKLIHGAPFSPEHMKKIFTSVSNPILTIAAQDSLRKKLYRNTDFLLDKSLYEHGNYRCVPVEGGHDVHVSNPERLAAYVSQFLLYGVEGLDGKSKL